MLYLQSASLGLWCSLISFLSLLVIDYCFPAKFLGLNLDLESFTIEFIQSLLGGDAKNVATLTWLLFMAFSTLFVSHVLVKIDNFRLHNLTQNYGVDANIILMGQILADSPLDAILYDSYVSNKLIMLSLSSRKVYVGVVSSMSEPNEVEGYDQEISLVPILSGYRDKDDLSVHWRTFYQDVDPAGNLRIVIRQVLIESASEFDFDTWDAFATKNSITPNNSIEPT